MSDQTPNKKFFSEIRVSRIEFYPSESRIEIESLIGKETMMMRFFGVKGVRMDGTFPMDVLLDFSIVDVSRDQMEGIRFRVSDETPGCISFFCREYQLNPR